MGLQLLHLNLHGLIRSKDLELGRDADTGGQTLYVLELIKSLSVRPEVEKVDLITRLIIDRRVSKDYSQSLEKINEFADIIRLPFGPKRYIRKELLWPYLDEFADLLVHHLQQKERLPDWIHAHYADAGYVGALVSRRLGIPLVFTGHSLGREKQRRMLAAGYDYDQIEQSFSISRRIEGEEVALSHSKLVITSTRQEAEQQYSRYGKVFSNIIKVIPPGVDSKKFHINGVEGELNQVNNLFNPFLRDSSLPPLLVISRAVQRKNIPALIEIFGRSSLLRQRHNLILVLGCREDFRQLDKQQKDVFQQIFELVDKYDLYGKVAYPKKHSRNQIPLIYRWAAENKGLFVNPALTEPFGLTLLEAAASGLPVVATDDGGPRDILSKCSNGLLADVTDLEGFQNTLELASSKQYKWKTWRNNGVNAVAKYFSWDAHSLNYLACMNESLKKHTKTISPSNTIKSRDNVSKRLLLFDLDNNIENNPDSLSLKSLRFGLNDSKISKNSHLGVITGRSYKAAKYRFSELSLPVPKVWICRAGTEIYYSDNQKQDKEYQSSIDIDWDRRLVIDVLSDFSDHLEMQSDDQQGLYKVSYLLKEPGESILPLIRNRLRQQGCQAMPFLRCHWYLDILPLRASRSEAIRFLSLSWGLPLEKIFVIASQQGDAELVNGMTTTVIPMNYDPSLEIFRTQKRVYFESDVSSSFTSEFTHYRYFFNH